MPIETKASRILTKLAAPAMAAAASYALEKQAAGSLSFKSLIPGMVAGAASTIATAPLDRVKDTMTQFANQAAEARRQGKEDEAKHLERASKNLGAAAHSIYKTQGPRGFYKGMTGSLVKMPIAMGMTFAIAENLKQRMKL